MFRRILNLLFCLLILLSSIPSIVYATSGCCSHHGGVDCSRKQANGQVICNDGWTGSSCSYNSMVKCSGYSSAGSSSNSINDDNYKGNKSNDNFWYTIEAAIVVYVCYKSFSNRKRSKRKNIKYSSVKSTYSNTSINSKNSINHSNTNANIPEEYAIFRNAINSNLKLIIKYISQKNKITIREIIPIEIYAGNNNYYLRAFCLLRNEERVFKISRIVEVKISN